MGLLRRKRRISGYETSEVYDGLRGRVLGLTPEELGVDPHQTPILAALMELGYPEAVASLVAVADGSASLYFSNGGGTIGAGEHDSVARAARSFLEVAGNFAEQMEEVELALLPARGEVRFHLVSGTGIVSAEALEDVIKEGEHPLLPLFDRGHALIAAIREVS